MFQKNKTLIVNLLQLCLYFVYSSFLTLKQMQAYIWATIYTMAHIHFASIKLILTLLFFIKMKSTFLLFGSLFFSWAAFSQSAITINASDMPVPTSNLHTLSIMSANPPAASLGDNQNWDYSSYGSSSASTVQYLPETRTFFTNAGVDIYFDAVKGLAPLAGYAVAHEVDFNTSGIYYKGMTVYKQSQPLVAFTGNSGDSLKLQEQLLLFSTPRMAVKFPCTANSGWRSQTNRAVVNFNITVASAGLNNTPGQHVFRYVENDSVVGWGKLRIYTPNGPSIPYDVLMVRYETYTIDSIYLNGMPAPAPLLSAFGTFQGNKAELFYAENFHMKGSWYYLMRRFYKNDNTYSVLSGSNINMDNISTTGIEEEMQYSSLIFPNPTNGSELNVEIMGKNIAFSQYEVMDMMGRTVQTGKTNLNGMSKANISLNENLANGTYFIKIIDTDNQAIITEKFDLIR